MSRKHAPMHTQWQAAVPNMDVQLFHSNLEAELNQANFGASGKPSGRAELNANLGYPDFDPATIGEKEEDRLNPKVLREGFCDLSLNLYTPGQQLSSASGRLDEHGSMEENFGLRDLEKIRMELNLPRKEEVKRPKKMKQKCALFPEPDYTGANYLDTWLKHLATCDKPLASLAKEVPYISALGGYSRGREVLNRLTEHQVPLLRAVWFVKVTLLKEQMDRSLVCPTQIVDRQVENKLCDVWTEVLTESMLEHFKEFASSKGKCDCGSKVEALVRKWGYLVRLADWCYHDGIITRHRYIHWVLGVFEKYVRYTGEPFSWSAELMLPLIANVFPDLCKLRTDIPELVKVCVSRFMCEVLDGVNAGSTSSAVASPSWSSSPVSALLLNLRKLVQSLLVVYPEAFLSLSPDVQAAWRLIETEANIHEFRNLKAVLRNEPSSSAPSLWLHVAMPWVEFEARAVNHMEASGVIERQVVGHLDEFCSGRRAAHDVHRLWEQVHSSARHRELQMEQQGAGVGGHPAEHRQLWKMIFDEHRMGRIFVATVCGWATSQHRAQFPEALHVTTSFLRILARHLTEICRQAEASATGGAAQAGAGAQAGKEGGAVDRKEGDGGAARHEYALQGFLCSFLDSFVPEEGFEEVEMSRLERLFGELSRARLFDHDGWVHGLLARGLFEPRPAGQPADPAQAKHHRLLSNLAWYPENPHDVCQRSILLRSVGVMDLGFMLRFYAIKINRYLFWSPTDASSLKTVLTNPASNCFDGFGADPSLKPVGGFTEERATEIEWDESVSLAWLQHERPHHDYSDPFTDGVVLSQAHSVLLSALGKILGEAPQFVLAQLSRHLCAVVKLVVSKGVEESVELDIIDMEGVIEGQGLSDEVLFRASTLLELSGDSYSLVVLLQWLVTNNISSVAAIALLENLHTVRAVDMTASVFRTCAGALARVEASAGRPSSHTATCLKELMRALVKQASETCVKSFEEVVRDVPTPGPCMQAVSAAIRAVKLSREGGQADRAALERDADLGLDKQEEDALAESIRAGSQRPDLAEAVGQALSSRESFDALAEAVVKRMSETKAGHGVLVSTVLKAAVNGTLREIRSSYRFGCTGFAISAYSSLLWSLDKKVLPKLPRILLHIVMERMYDPAVVPAEESTPSTVDTPQPQTPFSPQTPDSTVVAATVSGSKEKEASDVGHRQEAALAFVGVLLARGQLAWEDVEQAVKAKLEHFVKSHESVRPNFAKFLLKFVELLLTDKVKGAAAMMPRLDWQKLCVLRQTQASIAGAYLMLKYLAQLTDEGWKQPALECIEHIVRDDGFCRIAARDNPHSFFKDCSKPCMRLLMLHNQDIETPFRSFSFSRGRRKGALEAVQAAVASSSPWTAHYACTELRILVDAWKGGLAGESSEDQDGVALLRACPDEALQGHMAGFLEHLGDDSRRSLGEALRRPAEMLMEHSAVVALLASLWRQPERAARTADLAKAMGLSFADKSPQSTPQAGWFEEQMLKVVLAALGCEPVAKGAMGLHTFFELFLHPLALPTGHCPDAGSASERAHREAFEQAVVQFVGAYPAGGDGGPVGPFKVRLDFAGKLVDQTLRSVEVVEGGEYEWGGGKASWGWRPSAGGGMPRPLQRNLQLAMVLRLRLMAEGLAHLLDDGAETRELLQRTIACLQRVYSCEALLSDDLGDAVHRTAMLLVDRVGSVAAGGRGSLQLWFRQEAQRVLLIDAQLPRDVQMRLSQDLAVKFMNLTSGGYLSAPPHDFQRVAPPVAAAADGHAAGEGATGAAQAEAAAAALASAQAQGFEAPFDVDAWLLLEEHPAGVLSARLAGARKRPRTHLKYEFVSPEQALSAKHEAEQQQAAEEARQEAPAGTAGVDDDVMQLDDAFAAEQPDLMGDGGGWGGWEDAGMDAGGLGGDDNFLNMI